MSEDEKYILISPSMERRCEEAEKLMKGIMAKMDNNENPTAEDIDEYMDCMGRYYQNGRDQMMIYLAKIEVLEFFYKDDPHLVQELKIRKESTMENIQRIDDHWLNCKVDWRTIRDQLKGLNKRTAKDIRVMTETLEDFDDSIKH